MKKTILSFLLLSLWVVAVGRAATVECLQTQAVFYAKNFPQPLMGIRVVDQENGWRGSVSRVVFEFSPETPIEKLAEVKLWYTTKPFFTPSSLEAKVTQTWEGHTLTLTREANENQYFAGVGEYLWLTVGLAEDMALEAKLDVKCSAIHLDGAAYEIVNGDPVGEAYVYNFQKRVIPYYRQQWLPTSAGGSGWGSWNDRICSVVTDFIHFNIGCDTQGNLTGDFSAIRAGANFLKQKRVSTGSKMRILIGLAHCDGGMTAVSANAELTEKLINNLCNFIEAEGYDGVDLDWEYPDSAAEYAHFVTFVSKLKPRLFTLGATFSVAVNSHYMAPPTDLMHQCDFVNFMSYDLAGEHAPYSKITTDLAWGKNAGIDPIKLVGGLPFYSNETRSARNWDEQQGYGTILSNLNAAAGGLKPNVNHFVKNWGNVQGQPHYFNGVDLIQQKARYVRGSEFGGVMIWCYDGEASITNQRSLARALAEILPGRERSLGTTTYYVDVTQGSDSNDGLSWATAKRELPTMIAHASAGDEIRVSSGTVTLNRKLILTETVTLSGGWNVTGEVAQQEGYTTFERGTGLLDTHAMCELLGNHITLSRLAFDGKQLDKEVTSGAGVTISGNYNTLRQCRIVNCVARQRGAGIANLGGGTTLEEVDIRHCKLLSSSHNRTDGGAALYTEKAGKITHCTFVENSCEGVGAASGGAILASGGTRLEILNSTISANTNKTEAANCMGAALMLKGVNSVTIRNCLIANNEFAHSGNGASGAIAFETASGTNELINNTLVGNKSDTGLAVAGTGSSVRVKNCLLWNNGGAMRASYAHTHCAADYEGNGVTVNLATRTPEELFAPECYNTTQGYSPYLAHETFALCIGSPCIHAGDNSSYGSSLATDFDLAGNARLAGETIDIGAHEIEITTELTTATRHQGLRLAISGRHVAVECASAEPLVVYDMQGRVVAKTVDRALEIAHPGIYLITCGGDAEKIVIQ